MRVIMAAMIMLFAVLPLLAQTCDPDQPAPYSATPVYAFDWPYDVSQYRITFIRVEWNRPGDAGWTVADDLYCNWRAVADANGNCCMLVWRCAALDLGFAVQKVLATLPGTDYSLRVRACRYDQGLERDVCSEPSNVTGPWCVPEFWSCSADGCSEIKVGE